MLLGQGGDRRQEVHSPENLISVCGWCHDRIHAAPAEARLLGWLVWREVDPAAVPVWAARRGLVFLTGDGSFADAADVEAGDEEVTVPGRWSL